MYNSHLLVITPLPFVTESLKNFVVRVAELNGYSRPGDILRLAGCTENEIRSSKVRAKSLEALLGRDVRKLLTIAYSDEELDNKRYFKVAGSPVHSMHMQTKVAHLCPECVLETGFIHAFYDLKYAIACPFHGRFTLTECPECGASLTSARPGLLQCKCGSDLSNARGKHVEDESVLTLLGYLWQRLSNCADTTNQTIQNKIPVNDLDLLEFNVVLGLILRLGRVASDQAWNFEGVRNIVSASGMALTDWPQGLYRYLEHYHGASGVEQDSLGFRAQFSRFYNLMTKSNLPSDEVGFIMDALHEFGANHWKRAAKRSRNDKSDTPSSGDMVGITAAAKYMGVQPQTVRKLVDEGVITPAATTTKRSGALLIELSERLPKKVNYGSVLSARVAAKSIGVPEKVLFSLRRLGIYRMRRIAGKVNSFHEDDIDEFKVQLSDAAVAASRCLYEYEDSMSLSEAMRMKTGSPDSKAYIIDGIMEGRIKCALGSEVDFTEIRLLCADVVKEVKAAQEFIDGYVTKVRAAEMIGCDVAVIRWLLDHGYLAEKDNSSTLRISVTSINGFKDEYVACAVLAKQLHTNTRRVERRCKEVQLNLLYAKREHIQSYQPFLKIIDVAKLKQLWL